MPELEHPALSGGQAMGVRYAFAGVVLLGEGVKGCPIVRAQGFTKCRTHVGPG
jgi:hypothetical protein